MIRLSKKTHYGLIALRHLCLNKKGEISSVKEISNSYNLPQSLLAKILQKLSKKGIVSSISGVNGGYTIAKSPSIITVIDVIEAVDGRKIAPTCYVSGNKDCFQSQKCEIKKPVMWLNKKIYDILKETKISELIKEV